MSSGTFRQCTDTIEYMFPNVGSVGLSARPRTSRE